MIQEFNNPHGIEVRYDMKLSFFKWYKEKENPRRFDEVFFQTASDMREPRTPRQACIFITVKGTALDLSLSPNYQMINFSNALDGHNQPRYNGKGLIEQVFMNKTLPYLNGHHEKIEKSCIFD